MPRLLLDFGTPRECQFPLKSGPNRLGRSPDNDFEIAHHSVSTHHCEIVVTRHSALVRDLGSTNGTFIDRQPVREAALHPGQKLKLGDVEMVFDADAPVKSSLPDFAANPGAAPVTPPAAAVPPATDAPPRCKKHPQSPAQLQCAQCHGYFCDFCVSTRRDGGALRKFCRVCGGECERLSPLVLFKKTAELGFFESLPRAFSYPFQGDGWILMTTGTLFYVFVAYLTNAFAYGLYAKSSLLIVCTFAFGYLFAYMVRIIAATVEGRDEMPDWPDFGGMEDVAMPFYHTLGVLGACFLPGLLALLFLRGLDWGDIITIGLFCAGLLYLPMSFLAISLFDAYESLNPLFIIPSILRVWPQYLVVCAVLAVSVGGNILVNYLLDRFVPIMAVPDLISGFFGLYFLTVEMRVLGLLYRTQREELKWFRHR